MYINVLQACYCVSALFALAPIGPSYQNHLRPHHLQGLLVGFKN